MITQWDKVVFSNGTTTKYIIVNDTKEIPVIDTFTWAMTGNMLLINNKYSEKFIRPAMKWEAKQYY